MFLCLNTFFTNAFECICRGCGQISNRHHILSCRADCREVLILIWVWKSAGFIRGRHLFDGQCYLEKMQYVYFYLVSNHQQMLFLSKIGLCQLVVLTGLLPAYTALWFFRLSCQLCSFLLNHVGCFFSSIMTLSWNFPATWWFWFKSINIVELIPGVHITPYMSVIFNQGLQYKYWDIFSLLPSVNISEI